MARYDLTGDSTIEINARSSVHPVTGQTRAVRGSVEGTVADGRIALDPQPTGWLEVPVDELRSGHRLQDIEMRRRIDAKRFTTIRYDLERVEGGPDRFTLTGSLTFHGMKRTFTEEVTVKVEGELVVVEGEHTFDITDFGVKAPKILTLQVYPDVRVTALLIFGPVD